MDGGLIHGIARYIPHLTCQDPLSVGYSLHVSHTFC
jgi:hypothetical protein